MRKVVLSDKSDFVTFCQIYLNEDYKVEINGLDPLKEGLKEYDENELAVLDLGANIGLFSRYIQEVYDFRGKIFCVEPSSNNLKQIPENIIRPVNIVHAAISDERGSTRLETEGLGNNSYYISGSANGELIRTLSVEDIITEYNLHHYKLVVKIDIEGAEDLLFRSNSDWFNHVGLVIIELHDWMFPGQGKSKNFFRTLAESPHDTYFFGENLWCLINNKIEVQS